MSHIMQDPLVMKAAARAAQWQSRANSLLTSEEKRIQSQMAKLLNRPEDKIILTKLIDRSFRSSDFSRVAEQVAHVLDDDGFPRFFSLPEKALALLFTIAGRHVPGFSVPKLVEAIRRQSSRAIVPGEPDDLRAHLHARKAEGVRMNINHLGEAVLGEGECRIRLKTYLDDLNDPDVEYISVKISTIYSQISSFAFEETVSVLVERLSLLYRTAAASTFCHPDGRVSPKFVNLDMEEYRDLAITAEAFQRTLDQPEFFSHRAGLVLQAYLPDAWPMQQHLTEWAKKRVAAGGAPIKIRLVKGANMEMEQVDAALHNWPLAPYDNKLYVDANYRRMVDYGMNPGNMGAVHLGIASHNLFELAYAWERAVANGVRDCVGFEMLEGMADHVRRAIQETTGAVLYYAPVASKDQFINAIAYLIRRLDENTGPENFLRYACQLSVHSAQWKYLADQYYASCNMKDRVPAVFHRNQNRSLEEEQGPQGTFHEKRFVNEADTDFSLTANRSWAQSVREKWEVREGQEPLKIPLVIAGEEVFLGRQTKVQLDPSTATGESRRESAIFAMGTGEDVEKAVATAVADPDGWRSLSFEERHRILSGVAVELRRLRGDLIGAAAANTGKLFSEADPEISEAIDFVEFYPYSVQNFTELSGIGARGRGVGVVVSPWNFPVAIPCGGVAASLAAGNTVIFKPASDAVLAAWVLCQAFWKAGVSRNTLQFLPGSGSSVGSKLVNHAGVDFVILTGGTETGIRILKDRPDLLFCAETGGKNGTIVSSMSDRDAAIANVIHSAFSNTGQKCSATSLLVLEKDVYDDEKFRQQLVDAASSWHVGTPWDFRSKIGPLVQPPSGDLLRAMTTLEPGEEWALKPEQVGDNPYLWTPGIKYGSREGGYSHMTEFFGPLLCVMRAENMDHAISIVNATGYGLTSALESLDPREQEKWKSSIRAGNLYINRGSTGAIVLRQPFGGMGKSALGSGIKAGGPNYVSQFMTLEEKGWPRTGSLDADHSLLRLSQDLELKAKWGGMEECKEDILQFSRAVPSYLYWWQEEFSREKDYFRLRGQDNLVRYLPVGKTVIRIHARDSLFDILARVAACRVVGAPFELSAEPGCQNAALKYLETHWGKQLLEGVRPCMESDRSLAARIPFLDRIRYAAEDRVPRMLLERAAETGFYVARTPVLMEGRIELLQYLREQSICHTYHRYGNLGERGLL
ncbi:bifunctional proline dehydrogenase/L-glutamate gamma-semialdehyde dehydrogenase [Desulfobotulus sp. H1]|uniref:L-glutamate gamma-semialdehyde dehydrogenase n=1 Tax=Desulfobotulus pelophilus TaxID=2823377 RepID=A0ABT3NCT8_9BACT|nr:bifunctional proline dehydrogenase/L-glutamate gamma-semialdehyde dehydrogenase [Desulfobotulus pelophilus]MCW7755290.1 bifunctional proline dehydrogenase/L-glutamate gamma-semialdehyde dehydrogenase [Desulfobotulus pelophilus]